ncbi:MAG TPA: PIN domain-containing protein [Nitrososphaera sp.]|nr:PIN domain-containing protein [Nitrososphaera sp.]
MARPRRDKEHLGIDSNVLVAYLVAAHPDHGRVHSLRNRGHAVNPTVIHETYHACVFKLKVEPWDMTDLLLEYMRGALFLNTTYGIVVLGLKIAREYGIGGRDSLILASYLMSGRVSKLVTLDRALLGLGKVSHGGRSLKIISPDSL